MDQNAIELRPTTENDLDYILQAEQDPENRAFILPWTREAHAKACQDSDLLHRIIVCPQNGRIVGFLICGGATSPHRSLEFRRVVVTEKEKGFGRAAVRAVKELAFTQMRVHRLWLDVKEHNQRARALYRSEGFREEGLLRESLFNGAHFDSLVIMAMLESEYLS